MEEQVTELARRVEELEHYIGFEKERQRKKVALKLEKTKRELARWARHRTQAEASPPHAHIGVGSGREFKTDTAENVLNEIRHLEKQVVKFTELLSKYQ